MRLRQGGNVASVTREYAEERYGLDEEGRICTGVYAGQPWQVAAFHLLAQMGIWDSHPNDHRFIYALTAADRRTYDLPYKADRLVLTVENGRVQMEVD